jgi:hypothetical protein
VPQNNNTSHLGVSSMAASPLSENAIAGSLSRWPDTDLPPRANSPRVIRKLLGRRGATPLSSPALGPSARGRADFREHLPSRKLVCKIPSREPCEWRPGLVRRNSAGPFPVRDENDRDEAGLAKIHVTGEGIYFLRAKPLPGSHRLGHSLRSLPDRWRNQPRRSPIQPRRELRPQPPT